MARVLVSDTLSMAGVEAMEAAGLDVTVRTGLGEDELVEAIGRYDALVVRSQTQVTARVIDAADSLRVVGRAGVGVDNIDLDAATKRGVLVMNTPGASTVSTAEHTIALMLALTRHISAADDSVKSGKWERKRFQGSEIAGKTLGIVGVGRVGTEVARRAHGLGMKVIASDPLLTPAKAETLDLELMSFDEILPLADFISLHVPLRDATRHMISANEFERMKPGVRIINCARGGVVDEPALLDAIKSGKVSGAALDVYEQEPPAPSELIQLDNVVLTPHVAASTSEAQENVAVKIAEQIRDYLDDGTVANAVNMPSMDAKTMREVGPFLTLAERMGKFMAQFVRGKVSKLSIDYRGRLSEGDVRPVSIALLKGYLEPKLGENVNYVNAQLLAREHGIEVEEVRSSEPTDFANLVHVTAEGEGFQHDLAGTVFGAGEPRIVFVDGYHIDAAPQGVMLVCFNQDKPGAAGLICTSLGDAGVNIANMALGRKLRGGQAVTILNLDGPVGRELLDHIRSIDLIDDVFEIDFQS